MLLYTCQNFCCSENFSRLSFPHIHVMYYVYIFYSRSQILRQLSDEIHIYYLYVFLLTVSQRS